MRTLVIQAGGKSQRMGQIKALMPFCGEPLIERVLRRTRDLADETILTSNSIADFEYLGFSVRQDLIPGKGALGGLYTALKYASNPEVIVVACDMPFVNPRLLLAEIELLGNTNVDAIIPQSLYGAEPLHAVYRRDICGRAVKRALDAGQLRLSSWFSEVSVYNMTSEEIGVYDSDFLAFSNINTPEEFQKAENLAREVG